MCEKQILVPNSSILYCSEKYVCLQFPQLPSLLQVSSCRQRDSAPPTPTTFLSLASPKMILSSYNADIDDPSGARIPTYVPRMQPTPRTFTNDRIPPKFHEGTSDLDPTEWKPAEAPSSERQSPGREWKPKLLHRPSSEAFAYLSKFHRSSDSLTSKRRPLLGHSRTMSRTAPSLTHTPTASTSSESSLAGTPDESLASSLTLTSTTQVSDGGFSLKEGGDGADLTYEKKFVPASLGSATGSLKRLLATTAAGM